MDVNDLIKFQNQNDLYVISIWLQETSKQINRFRSIPDELRELRILLLQLKHDIEERINKYKKVNQIISDYNRRYL